MTVTVTVRGDRELALLFDQFPERMRGKLRERITALVSQLEGEIEAVTPVKTGRLRSEITERIYSDDPSRVAGYVSVYAASVTGEYAKAATLEYGTNKARRLTERRSLIARAFGRGRRRIVASMSKPVHIAARRYLRGPFETMEPEIRAALEEAMAEAVAEGNVA